MKVVEAENVEIPKIVQEAMITVVDYLVDTSGEEEGFFGHPDGDHHNNIYIATAIVRSYLRRSLWFYSENKEDGVCPECGHSDLCVVKDGHVFGVCMLHRLIWRTGIFPAQTLDEWENDVRLLLARDFKLVEKALPPATATTV